WMKGERNIDRRPDLVSRARLSLRLPFSHRPRATPSEKLARGFPYGVRHPTLDGLQKFRIFVVLVGNTHPKRVVRMPDSVAVKHGSSSHLSSLLMRPHGRL